MSRIRWANVLAWFALPAAFWTLVALALSR